MIEMDRFKNESKKVLVERAKELECLYLINEAFMENTLSDILLKITEVTPVGFKNYKACKVEIILDNVHYAVISPIEQGDELLSDIIVNDITRGYIKVMYPLYTFDEKECIFLSQEKRLLDTIAARISDYLFKSNQLTISKYRGSWKAILNLLEKTDHEMLSYVCEKMLALLARTNTNLLSDIFQKMDWTKYKIQGEVNFSLDTLSEFDIKQLSNILFQSANTCFDDATIYDNISLWIYQGKTYALIKKVDKKDSDAKSIADALAQYVKAVKENEMASIATKRWLTVELIRRFLTESPTLISNAQKYISIDSFSKLLDTFICSPKSMGKIGGKGTGFFIANQIIESYFAENTSFKNIKIPKTWYIASDELVNLIERNGLDELNEHKYRDILEIRTSYPRIIQMLKNSKFSSYLINELDHILDCCLDKPLIVRSSSLLEDQIDTSFSGKYKSLFLTNIGTRSERLTKLMEGILEVYASIFNPDSIQYRKERNLLDCSEQMGIMIQEVVGNRVGPYFFPLYAGVAFSNNEFRWSPRIKREDGLIRMVMGLGTRAVDRVGEDFPILISPGQPNLLVNQSPFELKKYSPQMIDVIDVENNKFLTLKITELIKEFGDQLPHINQVASVLKDDMMMNLNRITTDFQSDDILITFNGLMKNTSIISQVHSILTLLKEKLGYPVDIEFASDGENFYLLQCRPQSSNYDNKPVAIPVNIPFLNTIFTANKHISNGKVTGIKTVVYVDPFEYGKLHKYEDYIDVANAVGELNQILPRKSFILMGPGRWGSRGDIKLGVPISYSDINNTAMLIEIALKESKYQPELSFGTHFFQDLVEENIKYLPLYPEDNKIIFNKSFFTGNKNHLDNILPSFSHLHNVLKIIQIDKEYFNKELIILMSADLEKAIAYLDSPVNKNQNSNSQSIQIEDTIGDEKDQGWKWRHYMAEQIANVMDLNTFGVKGIYLFGSTNTCTAKHNSDIDLLVHFDGTDNQKQCLDTWLKGWSMALAEMNFLKTGYKSEGLLDIHYLTNQDILNKTSYAIKINSIYDPAYPLKLRDIK